VLDSIRYGLAYLTLGSMPAAIGYWYLIHGFVDFWRRAGKPVTYSVMVLVFAANLAGVWWLRDPLLTADLGVRRWMWAPAALLYLAAILLELQCRRQLKFHVLAGSPELSRSDGDRGVLLNQGIYARIRHPRYVSVVVGMTAVALFVNYTAMWVAAVLVVPALYLVVLLEERELRQRFGEQYADYARRVPRFVPRLGR